MNTQETAERLRVTPEQLEAFVRQLAARKVRNARPEVIEARKVYNRKRNLEMVVIRRALRKDPLLREKVMGGTL